MPLFEDSFAAPLDDSFASDFDLPMEEPPDVSECCIAAPPPAPPDSLFTPCALARPVPAISASAATETMKRFVILLSPQCLRIARATNGRRYEMFLAGWVPALCFLNAR